MKRKVNLVGRDTLTISLPRAWIKTHGIEKGDELHVETESNSVKFIKADFINKEKEFSADISRLNVLKIKKLLRALYVSRHTKITLKHFNDSFNPKNEEQVDTKELLKKLVERYTGYEIISQTDIETKIESVVIGDDCDFESLQKRVNSLVNEILSILVDNLDSGKLKEMLEEKHDEIDRFLNLMYRTILKSDKNTVLKNHAYLVYKLVEYTIDKIRYTGERIDKYGTTEKSKKSIIEVVNSIKEIFTFLVTKPEKGVVKRRYELLRKIRDGDYQTNEYKVISELMHALDFIIFYYEFNFLNSKDF